MLDGRPSQLLMAFSWCLSQDSSFPPTCHLMGACADILFGWEFCGPRIPAKVEQSCLMDSDDGRSFGWNLGTSLGWTTIRCMRPCGRLQMPWMTDCSLSASADSGFAQLNRSKMEDILMLVGVEWTGGQAVDVNGRKRIEYWLMHFPGTGLQQCECKKHKKWAPNCTINRQ
jgi:hypothetical protein